MLADLGAAKGVIAALTGWTAQAAQVAEQAGIELWGPDELAARLGQMAVSDLRRGSAAVQAIGIPFTFPRGLAQRVLERLTRGRFGFSRETMEWYGPLWLPAWCLQIGLTHLEGTFRKVPRIGHTWNLYEALSGHLVGQDSQLQTYEAVDISPGYLPTKTKAAEVERAIMHGFAAWSKVTTDAAKRRHANELAQLGIRVPIHAVAVETTTLVYLPYWGALLRKGAAERFAVVGGTTGDERPHVADVLTANGQLVHDAIASSRGSASGPQQGSGGAS